MDDALNLTYKTKKCKYAINTQGQRAEKLMFDSQGLLDFAVGLVDYIPHLPDVKIWENFNYGKTVRDQ